MGVSRWPVHDFNHRTTADMWLYRAYSGNLYHNGEQTLALSSYTQGDYITCVLDMEARTVSFGKNGEVRWTHRMIRYDTIRSAKRKLKMVPWTSGCYRNELHIR